MTTTDAEPVSMITPGPWEYDPREVRLIAPEIAPLGIKTGALIWDQTCGPSPADGCLIAAAPDLLEALRDILFDMFEELNPDIAKRAMAAIAKAEGRDV